MQFERRLPALLMAFLAFGFVAVAWVTLVAAPTDPDWTPLLGVAISVLGLGVLLGAMLSFHRIVLAVEHDRVEVRYGSSPFRTRLPLTSIESVEAVELTWWKWGGLGYRGSRKFMKRAAVVMRPKGPGVQFNLADGTSLAVSVADPAPVLSAIALARQTG